MKRVQKKKEIQKINHNNNKKKIKLQMKKIQVQANQVAMTEAVEVKNHQQLKTTLPYLGRG